MITTVTVTVISYYLGAKVLTSICLCSSYYLVKSIWQARYA